MKKRLMSTIVGVIVGAGVLVTMATAHSEKTGNTAVDNRIAKMKQLGANMGAIGKVAKGEAAYTTALNGNAEAIVNLARDMPTWFPEGSGIEAARSKPEIWDPAYKDAFQQDIVDLQTASLALEAAVETGDQAQIGAALKAAGGTCGACHKQFRKPKQ